MAEASKYYYMIGLIERIISVATSVGSFKTSGSGRNNNFVLLSPIGTFVGGYHKGLKF